MSVSFKTLDVGKEYDRPYLANLWGYKGFQAISRGVVTPSGTQFIILFVTKKKQEALTQYNDYIEGGFLHWEGEEKHGSDNKIINANSENAKIHLFYRDVHHSPFVYYGEIFLKEYTLRTAKPSQFVFLIGKHDQEPDLFEDIESHESEFKALDRTEKESIIKSRIGQGVFRDGVIQIWSGCAVTGLGNFSLLRASHIKPWRNSTNRERLDPMNGLLLQPTLDHLFDFGLITFGDDRVIQISKKLTKQDISLLNLSIGARLRKNYEAAAPYMKYHRDHVFKN